MWSGQSADRISVRKGVRKYYKSLGWDDRGIPPVDRLQQLEIEDLDSTFPKYR